MPKRTKPYLLHAPFRPDVEIDFDSYPFHIPAVRDLPDIAFQSTAGGAQRWTTP